MEYANDTCESIYSKVDIGKNIELLEKIINNNILEFERATNSKVNMIIPDFLPKPGNKMRFKVSVTSNKE